MISGCMPAAANLIIFEPYRSLLGQRTSQPAIVDDIQKRIINLSKKRMADSAIEKNMHRMTRMYMDLHADAMRRFVSPIIVLTLRMPTSRNAMRLLL